MKQQSHGKPNNSYVVSTNCSTLFLFREQRKQAAARIRQNAYLQEKLMQRREAKKKRDLAATASLARDEATRVEGGVALDSAIQVALCLYCVEYNHVA